MYQRLEPLAATTTTLASAEHAKGDQSRLGALAAGACASAISSASRQLITKARAASSQALALHDPPAALCWLFIMESQSQEFNAKAQGCKDTS